MNKTLLKQGIRLSGILAISTTVIALVNGLNLLLFMLLWVGSWMYYDLHSCIDDSGKIKWSEYCSFR